MFRTEPVPIVAVRLQVGPIMAYWLMNGADPEVWRALDKWNEAKAMVLCARLQTKDEFCATSFHLPDEVRALRFGPHRGPPKNAAFVQRAALLLINGDLAAMATSDIPAYPNLERVAGCLVSTKYSGTVGVVVVHDADKLH